MVGAGVGAMVGAMVGSTEDEMLGVAVPATVGAEVSV
jgi:hypothetical protein